MALTPGTRLGSYEIVSLVGAGGMGEVYRGRDMRLGRDVAIKVLPSPAASDPDRRKRLDREARAVSALNHPNICTLHDIGSQDGVDYLVMELVDGESLAARLTRGALPIDQALRYGVEIAEALNAAHRGGIVHRDLKPGNVMLAKTGAKLLDFGLAKAEPSHGVGDATKTAPLTEDGAILGTLQYMAPEQLEGKAADARTDIFAFGAVLYEMVTGRRAFDKSSQARLVGAILHEASPPIDPAIVRSAWGLDRVVQKCLAKDPDQRWQSAQDLRDELKWIAEGRSTPGPIVGSRGGATIGRRERVAWTAAGIALIVATAAFVWAVGIRRTTVDVSEERLDIATPPTTDQEVLLSLAVSPDGRQIVFVAPSDGTNRLWLRPLNSATARPLQGTEGATFPFWKPDNLSVGFFANGWLKRVDLSDGAVQELAPASSGQGGAWSEDGMIVFAPDNLKPLYRVPEHGGTVVVLTNLIAGKHVSHRFPQLLSDGRHLLFYAIGTPDSQGEYLVAIDSGDPIRLFPADTAAVLAGDRLLFIRKGTLFAADLDIQRQAVKGEPVQVTARVLYEPGNGAFSASATGVIAYRAGEKARRQLAWFDRSGKLLETVTAPDISPLNPDVSQDGRILFQLAVNDSADIWEGTRSGITRVTTDPANEWCAVWSKVGSGRFAFASNRNGVTYDLFQRSRDGTEKALFTSNDLKIPTDWSRDGHFLLYRVFGKSGSDLWVLPLEGDAQKPFAFADTQFDEREGQFSPDGHWVAYQSNERDHFEIYLKPFPGPGDTMPITSEGGTQPRWGANGKELFYIAPDGMLMSVPMTWGADGQPRVAGRPTVLFRARTAFGPVPGGNRQQYGVALDGRFLINREPDDPTAAPITVILHWSAGHPPRTR